MVVNFLAANPGGILESVNQRIIKELERANYSIWIANVWFTDDEIFNLLIKKIKEGLNVEIILDRNKPMDCSDLAKLQKFIDKGGEFFLTNETVQNNFPGKGFCMIDYTTVIDDLFDDRSYLDIGYSTYFLREYPEALVEHYINQYLSVKNNYCVNRYS